jgi:hypothetical protein
MSRITGTDAWGMMEAYNAVYTPEEISEEQIWEEVENWVNSLVEEGYDLSEFTWEEMYEEYISEIPINPGGNRPISNAPYQSRFARPMNAGTPQTYGGGRSAVRTVRPQIGGLPQNYRGQELQAAARANASQVRPTSGSPAGARPPAGAPAGGIARGSAPTSRPTGSAPATAKPTPTKTSTSSSATASTADKIAGGMKVYDAQKKAGDMKGAAETGMNISKMKYGDQLKPKTRNPLMDKTFGYQSGQAPDQQAAKTTNLGAAAAKMDTSKITKAAFGGGPSIIKPATTSAATAATTKPVDNVTPAQSKIASMKNLPEVKPAKTSTSSAPMRDEPLWEEPEMDLFDYILEYLIAEGYADTNENALVIMTNMSEEWRESIIEDIENELISEGPFGGRPGPVGGPGTGIGVKAVAAAGREGPNPPGLRGGVGAGPVFRAARRKEGPNPPGLRGGIGAGPVFRAARRMAD